MKKIVAVLLILAMAVSYAACGNTGTVSNETISEFIDNDTAEIDTETEYNPNIEPTDYNGADFTFLTRFDKSGTYCFQTDDLSSEEQNGEIINDEIYCRNSRIMDKYNLNFVITTTDNPGGLITKSVTSNEHIYNILDTGLGQAVEYSSKGMLYSLSELPYVDVSQKYWNYGAMSDMQMYGKYYVGVSDLTIQAYFSCGAIYFNKKLAGEYNLTDPYQLVNDGIWTFDKMIGMCKNVSADLNGNGKYDENDQYGLTFNNFAWQILFYGCGEKFVVRDSEGDLVFDDNNTTIIDYIQDIMPISLDETVSLYSENYSHLGGSYRTEVCNNAFINGQVMFWLEAMYGVPTLRNMECDFGLLPIPKYKETQKSHSSFIHNYHASGISVPITVTDIECVGKVLEDITYDSKLVRNAFIEKTLKGKYSRDNESADMIDIIVNNISVDYALVLNVGIDAEMRNLMNKGSTDISSVYAKKVDSFNAILNKFNASMKGNQ